MKMVQTCADFQGVECFVNMLQIRTVGDRQFFSDLYAALQVSAALHTMSVGCYW